MAVIQEMKTNDFETIINESQVPVLVDFWADWCAPCKAMEPMLEEICGLLGEKVQLLKVNVDEARQIAIRYHVQSLPTLLVFNHGRPVDSITGVPPRYNLVNRIEKHLS
jgi:thioredoxin 1